MMQELIEHLDKDIDNNQLRVIVLTAMGSIFSAGHNLKELVCILAGMHMTKFIFYVFEKPDNCSHFNYI